MCNLWVIWLSFSVKQFLEKKISASIRTYFKSVAKRVINTILIVTHVSIKILCIFKCLNSHNMFHHFIKTTPKPKLKKPLYQTPFVGLSTGLFKDHEKAMKIDIFLTEKFEQHIPEWKFKWDNAVQRYGLCRYKKQCISVSLPLARVNTVKSTKRTILHEIAHALTPGAKHNLTWKKKAKAIGLSNPTRFIPRGRTFFHFAQRIRFAQLSNQFLTC